MSEFNKEEMREKVKNLHASTIVSTEDGAIDTASNESATYVAQNHDATADNSLPPEPSALVVQRSESSPDTATDASTVPCPEIHRQKLITVDKCSLEVSKPQFSIINAQRLDPSTFPNQPHTGTILPTTIANLKHMLDEYGVKVTYNVIKKKLMIILPGHSWTSDNSDNVSITFIISLASLNGFSSSKVPSYVEAIADQNLYNPVADWITSMSWDGKDRLPEIYATVTVREGFPEHLKKILMKKWLLSAVAAVLKPQGFKARGVLTFQGPQGIGKTSFLSSLVNDPVLKEMVVKLDHHMDGNSKDSILGAISHWLVEIGELDSSFKKDVARLKGFLTSDHDKIRKPYAMIASEYPRRTVFFASVNRNDFLVDNTGNSRWWTIPVLKINYQHGIDMQQLWAQLAVDFNNGGEWWLAQQEEDLLEFCNREHLSISVIREKLLDHVDLEQKGKPDNPKMTATEVLKILGYDKPTNPQARECGGILRELFGDSKRTKGKDYWRIPLKINTFVSLDKDIPY